jgi:hypothetical protein
MQALDKLVLVIAEIIAAHCAGTRARNEFVQACLRAQWAEAQAMVEGMLAEPWHLVGYQERWLREFLEFLRAAQREPAKASSDVLAASAAWRNPGARIAWTALYKMDTRQVRNSARRHALCANGIHDQFSWFRPLARNSLMGSEARPRCWLTNQRAAAAACASAHAAARVRLQARQ